MIISNYPIIPTD